MASVCAYGIMLVGLKRFFLDRYISIENFAQVVIEENALGIERGADTPEIVPVRVERGQFWGCSCMHFAPMRTALVAFEDLLDMLKIGLVGYTAVHMHGNIGRVALVGRAEPDIV